MIASDGIKPLPNILQGGGRPHMHRPSDPPFARVRVVEGSQARRADTARHLSAKDVEVGMKALEEFETGYWGQRYRRSR